MYYTQEQIDRANQADLVSFLHGQGEQLTRAGNEYRWKRHDSMTIRGNKWYRHSQSKGGGPVDFVMEFFGKSFTEAVELLTGEKGAAQPPDRPSPAPLSDFRLPPRSPDNRTARNYLTAARRIDEDVSGFFFSTGDIYEEAAHHNAVFVGRDEDGVPRYAHQRGTAGNFRLDVKGSDKAFNFCYRGEGERLFVFEAPIDLLSFLCLFKKDWQKQSYGWGSSTICNILDKREYLGHTINFKTRKHFKDKKSHYVPEDEWTIFENTHEAIIDQETFDLAQKVRSKVRRYPDGWGDVAPLTGLLYCADCGSKMYVHRFNNGKRISQYTCSKYSKIPVGTLCKTQHRINESVVLELVKDLLKAIAEYAKHERAEFVRVVQEAQSSQQTAEVKKQRTRLATAKQRISELEVLLCKIYEDNILGKLSDSRYATLDAQYEKEQKELTAEISTLEKAISDYEKHEKDADRFIALIDKYENFDELTITMLNEFVEKILVHERDRKGSIQTTQEVEIYFNFVGRFVPPKFAEVELTPEELEEIRKREERKDRLHQNYLKRKASGWQRQYEDRTKAKKKAEMDAKKNALRAEDIAKGVFIPVSNMPKLEPKIAPQKGA